jgi:hypothetical protein
MRQPWSGVEATLAMKTGLVIMGDLLTTAPGDAASNNSLTRFCSGLLSIANREPTKYMGDPISNLFLPVLDSFEPNRTAVASLTALLHWSRYFEGILPTTDGGIIFILTSCTKSYSYRINGPKVEYLGEGDLHDSFFDSLQKSANFKSVVSIADSTLEGLLFNREYCPLEIAVYPTMVSLLYFCLFCLF